MSLRIRAHRLIFPSIREKRLTALHSVLPRMLAAVLIPFAFLGCQFDDHRLEALSCDSEKTCTTGFVCCHGFCVSPNGCTLNTDGMIPPDGGQPDSDPRIDQDGDGVANDKDNCPSEYNPKQGDGDEDGVGDVCDCAPTDPKFSATAVELNTFSTPVPFTPVENANDWQVIGTVYRETGTDGIHRSALVGQTAKSFIATVQFQFHETGKASFIQPPLDLRMAGVIVRTGDLSAGRGQGYYCGLDFELRRILLAKSQGDDLSQGRMSFWPYPTDPSEPLPGKPIHRVVNLGSPYRVTMKAEGSKIVCNVMLPDFSTVEISAVNESDFSQGGFALFTMGASADFQMVKVCVHD